MQKNSYNPLDDVAAALDDSFHYWEVDEKGNITLKDANNSMFISCDRLLELNWLTHELRKNRNGDLRAEREFYFVYLKALQNAGISRIVIDTSNINDLIV